MARLARAVLSGYPHHITQRGSCRQDTFFCEDDYRLKNGLTPNRQAGLTLIELMLVLAIVAILAGVAIPLYNEQIQRSRRTDAMAALTTVALAQERFYTANSAYAAALTDLHVDAALQEGNSKNGFYTLAMTNPDGTQSFSIAATAMGAQANDTGCVAFTLNQLGAKGAFNADGAANDRCW